MIPECEADSTLPGILEDDSNTTPPQSPPRARITVSSGLISLLMFGVTVWYLVEVCWAILADGVEGIAVYRWVELGCGLVCLLSSIAMISFIRVSG